jgi:tetratricopeptide (TPR) repeat protein
MAFFEWLKSFFGADRNKPDVPAAARDADNKFNRGAQRFPITRKGRIDRARELFKAAIDEDPRHARAHAWMGYTYLTAVVDTYSWFGWGIDNAPGHDPVGERPTVVGAARKCIDDALTYCQNDLERYDVHWARAFVELHSRDLGSDGQARNSIDEALRLAPRDAQGVTDRFLLAEMADCLTYLGDLTAAATHIQRAIVLGGATPEDWLYWELAWVRLCQHLVDPGNHPLSAVLSALERMRETPPDDTDDPPDNERYDFDALVIWCAYHALNAEHQPRRRRFKQLNRSAKRASRIPEHESWTKALELRRHPFAPGSILSRRWSEVLDSALRPL